MPGTTVGIPTRVLVLGMTHEDGTIDPEELDPVAEACGQSPEQVRSCLTQLVQEGLFVRADDDRYRATERGMADLGRLLDRTRLAYAQDAAGHGWDRRWRLVGFAVPEPRRSPRDAFRAHLTGLGAAELQDGLYVSPHPWDDAVWKEAERLHIADAVTMVSTDDLVVGGVRDPKELALRLWPVADVQARYQAFVEQHRDVLPELEERRARKERLPESAYLPGALAMAVAFQQIFIDDPLLPPELLPRPWPGRDARDLVVRSRRLAVAMRESAGVPALFRTYIDAIDR